MSGERNPIIGQPDLIWNQMMERMKNEPLDLTPTTPGGKDAEQRLKLVGELGEAAARIRLLEQQLKTARKEALEEAANLAKSRCEKCGGEGWLWAHELDQWETADNRSPYEDQTRYLCDGEHCKSAAAIRSLGEKATSPGSASGSAG